MGRPRTIRIISAAMGCFMLVSLAGCHTASPLGRVLDLESVHQTATLIQQSMECEGKRFWTERHQCLMRLHFSERACADAFAELVRTYHYRKGYDAYPLYRLLNTCGRAYCRRPLAPRPRLCDHLPLGPNPAGWFDQVEPFISAIDEVEGLMVAKTALLLGTDYGYCRAHRDPVKSASKVTLHLRRDGERLHVRATGALRGAWSFDSLSGDAPAPIINALYDIGFRGGILIRLENVPTR